MNALPFYKTRLAKAREAMIQMENEIAELKLSLDSSKRERNDAMESLAFRRQLYRFQNATMNKMRKRMERDANQWETQCKAVRDQRDALAEALIEMRYGHTDKAEKITIEALKYLTK